MPSMWREGDEILDQRRAVVGALAEADGAHLGERTDRGGEAAAGEFDAGDEGARHGSEPHGEHTELAGGGGDRAR